MNTEIKRKSDFEKLGIKFTFWDRPTRRVVLYMATFILFLFDLILIAILLIRKPQLAWVGWFYASVTFLIIVGLFSLQFWLEKLPHSEEEYSQLIENK